MISVSLVWARAADLIELRWAFPCGAHLSVRKGYTLRVAEVEQPFMAARISGAV